MKNALLDGLADNSPVVRENNRCYLRFDSISLESDSDDSIRVCFRWLGKDTVYLRLEGARITNTVTLTGIEGRQEIRLET